MSLLIRCDVEGCNTTDVITTDTDGFDLPPGWRAVTETRVQVLPPPSSPLDDLSPAGEAFGKAALEQMGVPKGIIDLAVQHVKSVEAEEAVGTSTTVDVSFHICALHDLPKLRQPAGAPPPPPIQRI